MKRFMIIQSLLSEFNHEVESTRKLLKAIPCSALEYKPSEQSWTTAQLASHIAEVYNWYPEVFEKSVLDWAVYRYHKGDISKVENIVAKFEENVVRARQSLENATEANMFENWKMVYGNDHPLMPEMMRIQVIRGFLMNHLYHHRGEMIVYLRSTGNKVPGLYGPTFEDMQNFKILE